MESKLPIKISAPSLVLIKIPPVDQNPSEWSKSHLKFSIQIVPVIIPTGKRANRTQSSSPKKSNISSSPVDLAALRRMDHYPREQRESTIDTGAPLTSQHIRENIAISYFLLFVFSKHPHLQKHWEASQMKLECWIILLRTSDALPTYLSWLPLVCQIPKDDWWSIIGLLQIQW